MAIKAVAFDDKSTQHLIIGLNRENLVSLIMGDTIRLPVGAVPALSGDSQLMVVFAETDDELAKRFPPTVQSI